MRALLCSILTAVPVLLYYTGATDGASSIAGITTSPPRGLSRECGILGHASSQGEWDGRNRPPGMRSVFH